MLTITPIFDRDKFDMIMSMRDTDLTRQWRERTIIFLDYLLHEDAEYTKVPDHKAYNGQNVIAKYLNRNIRRLQRFK